MISKLIYNDSSFENLEILILCNKLNEVIDYLNKSTSTHKEKNKDAPLVACMEVLKSILEELNSN